MRSLIILGVLFVNFLWNSCQMDSYLRTPSGIGNHFIIFSKPLVESRIHLEEHHRIPAGLGHVWRPDVYGVRTYRPWYSSMRCCSHTLGHGVSSWVLGRARSSKNISVEIFFESPATPVVARSLACGLSILVSVLPFLSN